MKIVNLLIVWFFLTIMHYLTKDKKIIKITIWNE